MVFVTSSCSPGEVLFISGPALSSTDFHMLSCPSQRMNSPSFALALASPCCHGSHTWANSASCQMHSVGLGSQYCCSGCMARSAMVTVDTRP